MQRKKIILCEGKHDLILLEELITKFKYNDNEYKLFRQREIAKTNPKKLEDTILFRSLQEKSSTWRLLTKSESGDKPTLKIFTWCKDLLLNDKIIEKSILWLDTDLKNLDKLIFDIHNRLKDSFGKQKIVLDREKIKEFGSDYKISLHKVFVKTIEGKELGTFFLLLISPSLEKIAEKLYPKISKVEEAIKELSKHKDVQEIFKKILE